MVASAPQQAQLLSPQGGSFAELAFLHSIECPQNSHRANDRPKSLRLLNGLPTPPFFCMGGWLREQKYPYCGARAILFTKVCYLNGPVAVAKSLRSNHDRFQTSPSVWCCKSKPSQQIHARKKHFCNTVPNTSKRSTAQIDPESKDTVAQFYHPFSWH